MPQKRQKRCPHYGFLNTIKWGKQREHTRYYCKSCNSYFTNRRPHISDKNKEVWFQNGL